MRRVDFVDYHLSVRAIDEESNPEEEYNEYFTKEDEKTLFNAWDSDEGLSMLPELLESEISRQKEVDVLDDEDEECAEDGKEKKQNDIPPRNWSYPENLKALEWDFVENYKSYMMAFDPEIEQFLEREIIRQLNELCTYKIYLRIWDHKAYNWREEERIANEASENALNALREQKQKGIELSVAGKILSYYRKIYKNMTGDFFRKASREAKLFDRMPTDADGNDISDQRAEFGTPFEDPFLGTKRTPKEIALMRKILRMYFQELMDYSDEPSKALAVMYARVLYQMEPHGDPDGIVRATEAVMRKKGWSTDPESKDYLFHWHRAQDEVRNQPAGASPAWAWVRMDDMDLELLEDDSEASMQRNFDESLVWGVSMREKLTRVSEKFAPAKWGELIYTERFTKADIQSWSDSVHESTLKKTAKRMSMDAECCKDAGNLMKKTHPLMEEFLKRTKKTRNNGRKGESR